MTVRLRAVGVDPAFLNTGIVRGFINMEIGLEPQFEATSIHLIRTKADKNKTIRQSADDFRRARFIASELRDHTVGADVVFVEMPSGAQSARAAKALGIALGCLTAIEPAIIQLTAAQVKNGFTGNKTASKATVIDRARTLHPDLEWLNQNADEHMADAIACVEAGVKTEEFRSMANMALTLARGDNDG